MLAGPEVGDHFMLNLYNKVIPLLKFWNIWVFFHNFFFVDIFQVVYMYSPKKVESDF